MHEATCTGGYSLHTAEAYLYLDGLTLSTECPSGAGVLRFRDSAGGWYDLALDCGACGDLTYGGDRALGTICPDLSALGTFLDATGSRW